MLTQGATMRGNAKLPTKCHSAEKFSPVVLFSRFYTKCVSSISVPASSDFAGKLSIGKLNLKNAIVQLESLLLLIFAITTSLPASYTRFNQPWVMVHVCFVLGSASPSENTIMWGI